MKFKQWLNETPLPPPPRPRGLSTPVPPPPPPPPPISHDYSSGTMLLKIQALAQKHGTPLYVRTKKGAVLEVVMKPLATIPGMVETKKGNVPESIISHVLNKDQHPIAKFGNVKL